MSEVTLLLQAAKEGKPDANERLWTTVYEELRRVAGGLMNRERREVTLTGTALVHEAWLRLCGGAEVSRDWEGRGHFFTAAAEAMRRILVDQARARLRIKRGGGQIPLELEHASNIAAPEDEKLIMVNDVLDELARTDPRKAHVVKLRFFVGYTNEETATFLGVSDKTVRREWKIAKAWLYQALKGVDPSSLANGSLE
jgi:RNA polymerase sigma factor (TIGR02999 family)